MNGFDPAPKKSLLRVERAFLDAFLSLMQRSTFESISVSDLIERSGYSRTTFYAHYHDKYDLLERIVNNEVAQFVASVCAPISQAGTLHFDSDLFSPGYSMFLHVSEYRAFYRLLLDGHLPGHSLDTFCWRANRVFRQVLSVELEGSAVELDYDLYYYISTCTYLLFIQYWARQGFRHTPEYMARQMMSTWVKMKRVVSVSVMPPPSARVSDHVLYASPGREKANPR